MSPVPTITEAAGLLFPTGIPKPTDGSLPQEKTAHDPSLIRRTKKTGPGCATGPRRASAAPSHDYRPEVNLPRAASSTSGRARKQLHTYKVQASPPSAVAEAAETRANGIMKKLILSLAMVLMVVAIQAPLTARSAPGEVTSAGKQFVELLAKGDLAGAVARFDAACKNAAPEP